MNVLWGMVTLGANTGIRDEEDLSDGVGPFS